MVGGGRRKKRKGEKERDGGRGGGGREEGESEASERGNARLDSSDRRREGVRFSSLAYLMRTGCFFSFPTRINSVDNKTKISYSSRTYRLPE